MPEVHICEVGPRDGLQIAKSRMPTAAKAQWIAAIADAGSHGLTPHGLTFGG